MTTSLIAPSPGFIDAIREAHELLHERPPKPDVTLLGLALVMIANTLVSTKTQERLDVFAWGLLLLALANIVIFSRNAVRYRRWRRRVDRVLTVLKMT